MASRLTGAALRVLPVMLLLATPALLLPSTSSDALQIIALVAVFATVLVISEYTTDYPGLVEFRDAPPFNRIRFGSLFLTVLLVSLIARGIHAPSTLSRDAAAVGALIGSAVDFPYSPVRLVVLMLPPGADADHVALVRSAAGMSYVLSLMTLAVFLIVVRLRNWPGGNGVFNVWVNLPTFDPTAGGDVVDRLERDARVNVALGFLLPFLMPAVIKAAGVTFGALPLSNPQAIVWTVSAWAFLPASLFMRGIAMGRIARMIEAKRRAHRMVVDPSFAPA